MNSRIAIIDMGTNTFHLLLAETDGGSYRIIYRDRVAVKLGKGGITKNLITNEAQERALRVLFGFKTIMEEYSVSAIYAFGTSALRNAANRDEVINRIKEVTGIDVHVISGDKEAAYIAEGVRSATPLGAETSLIIDIGGGSVEFIIANDQNIFWQQSIEMGAQRLLEMFQANDPITEKEISNLDEYFENALKPVLEALTKDPATTMVGSSGSFDTFSEMYCARYAIQYDLDAAETPLTIEGFVELYEELTQKNRAQRMLIPGMIEMRVDMIVVAACLVRYLLEHWNFQRVRVSTYSLKEGVLVTLARQVQKP
jgi:exopolyphosphatase / guanosine-5'-triphosphate,3'-diphosphate pyrophosphatase